MIILGIETSCDETSVAVVKDGTHVLSNVISSSKASFEKLAGVIPEEAARKQIECMIPVLEEALADAHVSPADVDAIAVTRGPGLLGSLLVGTMTARSIGSIWNKPVIGVHHTLGHLSSPWLNASAQPVFPLIALSASGGHTDLWYRESHTQGTLLGRTRDDAAGEAFDKGASLLGLPYPGGPSLSKAAENGDREKYPFPEPLSKERTLSFSFSGLKTALKYTLRDQPESLKDLKNICASYEHALCRHLLSRILMALEEYPDAKEVHLVGGVSANTYLRKVTGDACTKKNVVLRFPAELSYCTDNAAMIASAGYFLQKELGLSEATKPFETVASLPLEQVSSV